MKLSHFLKRDSIIINLIAQDKKGVIDELSNAVSKAAKADAKPIANVLMEREKLGSTGIGLGVAIPHGKLDLISSIVIGLGLSKQGVKYESLDNKPVHIFFVLLTSENSTGGHLKVLAQISKLLKKKEFKKGLLEADNIDEVYDIILNQDEEF